MAHNEKQVRELVNLKILIVILGESDIQSIPQTLIRWPPNKLKRLCFFQQKLYSYTHLDSSMDDCLRAT